jgi:hypothetical protein
LEIEIGRLKGDNGSESGDNVCDQAAPERRGATPVRKIFISYRRSDSEWAAGRLREALARHFGEEQIFRDKESIRPGVAWREEIQSALRDPSTVVLALIGPRWLSEEDAAGHRLIDRA